MNDPMEGSFVSWIWDLDWIGLKVAMLEKIVCSPFHAHEGSCVQVSSETRSLYHMRMPPGLLLVLSTA